MLIFFTNYKVKFVAGIAEQNFLNLLDDFTCCVIYSNSGEPGLLLIKLTNKKGLTFEGYKGRADENYKKIFRDVFQKGDQYINTGDMFIVDKDYDMFFHDRIGDTFRFVCPFDKLKQLGYC